MRAGEYVPCELEDGRLRDARTDKVLELLQQTPSNGPRRVSLVERVSLQLYEGETLGVIGRNGCGKTSMLQLMAGIMAPNSGTVTRRESSSAALLSIGLGFRRDLSGRDNALLAAMLQGSTRRQARSYLEEIKEFMQSKR